MEQIQKTTQQQKQEWHYKVPHINLEKNSFERVISSAFGIERNLLMMIDKEIQKKKMKPVHENEIEKMNINHVVAGYYSLQTEDAQLNTLLLMGKFMKKIEVFHNLNKVFFLQSHICL